MIATPKRFPRYRWLAGALRTLFFFLFIGLLLGSCRPLFEREVSGTVLAIEGTANKTTRGVMTRLTSDARIGPGEKLTCLSDNSVDLMLLPGLLMELKGNTFPNLLASRPKVLFCSQKVCRSRQKFCP